VEVLPEGRPRDSPEGVDARLDRGVGHVALDVVGRRTDQGEARGHLLDQPLERLQEHRQSLALLRSAHEQHPQLLRGRLGAGRRAVDIDPVRDHVVVAPEPAAAGPSGRLRDGDPGAQLVELPPGPEHVRDRVRHPLGRIGVERADHRRTGERAGVPGEHRRRGLVNVDDVEPPRGQLAPHRGDGGGKGGEVGDRAVGGDAHGALERDQVVGAPALLGGGAVEHPADAVRRVPGRHHPHLVAACDQGLGQRLDVSIDAARIGPRVGADERDAHRVDPGCLAEHG
jgi:hypothetical protein